MYRGTKVPPLHVLGTLTYPLARPAPPGIDLRLTGRRARLLPLIILMPPQLRMVGVLPSREQKAGQAGGGKDRGGQKYPTPDTPDATEQGAKGQGQNRAKSTIRTL